MKLLTFLVLFLPIHIYSQDSLSFNYFDQKTYNLYINNDWNELIKTSKQAFKKNYNSYYLNMRTGIAYYNKNNFTKATKYFEKASEFDKNPTLQEYLYFSYLFSGYSYKADSYSKYFTDTLKKKCNINNRKLNFIDVYYGSLQNNDFDKLVNYNFIDPNKVAAKIRFNNTFNSFYTVGLGLNFSQKTKFYTNFSHLNGSKTEILKTPYSIDTFENNTTQNSYYFNLKILNNNFTITTALNYLSITDVSHQPKSDFPFSFQETTLKAKDFVFNLNLEQKIKNFQFGVRGSYSSLNEHIQLLAEIEAYYYPFGNLNYYINTSTAFQNITEKTVAVTGTGRNSKTSTTKPFIENNSISKIKIGAKIFKHLWFEQEIYFGKIVEYNSANASIVYNEDQAILNLYKTNLIVPLNMRLSFFASYSLSRRQQIYYNYDIDPQPLPPKSNLITEKKEILINNSSITGGIKWNF